MTVLKQVEAVRQFNRFYTGVLGLLDDKMLKTTHSLTESRILFELSREKAVTASGLVKELTIDPAYLSRILKKFEKEGVLKKEPSPDDSRKQLLVLTDEGVALFVKLQAITNEHIGTLIESLSEADKAKLLSSMEQIQRLLSGISSDNDFITFRTHQPGDIGYLIYQHGRFYAREYGFDISFDQYVGGAMVKFLETYNEQKERLWVVEQHDQIMGSIAIVDAGDDVAQLRWFILEPEVHGKGVGKKLMSDAVQFCRDKQYKKVILWTFEDLSAARGLYEREGFSIVKTERHHIWGQTITEELWELVLSLSVDVEGDAQQESSFC